MPEVIWCVSLEWGLPFLLPALMAALALIILFTVLIWRGGGALSISWEKLKVIVTGVGAVSVVVTLLIVLGIGYVSYQGYKTVKDAYFVAINPPGRELGKVREDFQGETRIEITIKDPAKKFVIAGNYQGACVADLFTSICRQYADRISCATSLLNRTLIVDLKNP
jgi:hypothetical protein